MASFQTSRGSWPGHLDDPGVVSVRVSTSRFMGGVSGWETPMVPKVHILIFNLVGQRSIAPQPTTMRQVEAYLRHGRRYGLSDEELAQDVAGRWPSDRRVVEVETLANGEVWLTLAPARGAVPEWTAIRRRRDPAGSEE